MWRTTMTTLMAAVSVSLAAGSAEAQLVEVPRHRGFWFGFGLGGGWDDFDMSFGNSGRGGAAYIRMGGTVNPHVLVGGEIIAWFRETSQSNEIERENVSLTALLYPSKRGFFVKGGFGYAGFQTSPGFVDREGIGLTLGSGFDFRVGRNLFITPNVDVMTQFLRDDTNVTLLFTVGLGWH